jgi:hypothetical protein
MVDHIKNLEENIKTDLNSIIEINNSIHQDDNQNNDDKESQS